MRIKTVSVYDKSKIAAGMDGCDKISLPAAPWENADCARVAKVNEYSGRYRGSVRILGVLYPNASKAAGKLRLNRNNLIAAIKDDRLDAFIRGVQAEELAGTRPFKTLT